MKWCKYFDWKLRRLGLGVDEMVWYGWWCGWRMIERNPFRDGVSINLWMFAYFDYLCWTSCTTSVSTTMTTRIGIATINNLTVFFTEQTNEHRFQFVLLLLCFPNEYLKMPKNIEISICNVQFGSLEWFFSTTTNWRIICLFCIVPSSQLDYFQFVAK